jgi:two-component system sensor histidine kinase DctS
VTFSGVNLGLKRVVLWALLLALVLALLGTLIWLAGRYETSQIQNRLDRDAAESVLDIRNGLARNVQSFQALPSNSATADAWLAPATDLLRQRREVLRLERRSESLAVLEFVDSSYHRPVFERLSRSTAQSDVSAACAAARKVSGAAYSSSYFLPQSDGLGIEVFDMCLPITTTGRVSGYTVATYELQELLSELVNKQLAHGQNLSLTEAIACLSLASCWNCPVSRWCCALKAALACLGCFPMC